MPRRPRLAIAGIPWHIIQRGNNHTACFYTDKDYRYYLQTLREQASEHHCAIHAYVLMTNHVHLLLTPGKSGSAGLLMKHLGQRYVQYINRTYRRTGTLWEGRFKSCLTQEEDYVLACYRYIELNPVRAGMVYVPADYPWSSHRANAYGISSGWLTPHPVYENLGLEAKQRLAAYRDLFCAELDAKIIDSVRRATNGNYALGNDRFRAEIEQMLNRRARPGKSGRPSREIKAHDGFKL